MGPGVTIGQGSRIFAHAVIEGGTTIGERCQIHYGAVIGGEPQDLKYEGESTVCIVGDGTVIREYVTVSRGTRALGRTEIGEGCLLMAYVHVAHDCRIGDGVILSNAVNLAGHVTIDEQAIQHRLDTGKLGSDFLPDTLVVSQLLRLNASYNPLRLFHQFVKLLI